MSVSFNLADFFIPGLFLDFHDAKRKVWTTACIEEVRDSDLLICWDGEQSSQWVSQSSQTIQPFRSHIAGKGRPEAEQCLGQWLDLKEDMGKCAELMAKVNFQGKANFREHAYLVTQVFRGKLFFLVEEFTRKGDWNTAEQGAMCVVSDIVADLFTGWVKAYAWVLPTLCDLVTCPEKYLYEEKAALASIWPELFLMTRKLLACEVDVTDSLRDVSKDNPQTTLNSLFNLRLKMTETDLGGFAFLKEALTNTDATKQDKSQFPLTLIPQLPVWETLQAPHFRSTRLELLNTLRTRIQRYSDWDCLVNTHADVLAFVHFFLQQTKELSDEIQKEEDHWLLLTIGKKMLASDKMAVRMEGLKLMTEVGQDEDFAKGLLILVLREGLVELILRGGFQPATLQRSQVLFNELARCEAYDHSRLDSFLKTANESQCGKALTEVLVESAAWMPRSTVHDLYSLLKVHFPLHQRQSIAIFVAFMRSVQQAVGAKRLQVEAFCINDFATLLQGMQEIDAQVQVTVKRQLVKWLTAEPFDCYLEPTIFIYLDEIKNLSETQCQLLSCLWQRITPEKRVQLLEKYQRITSCSLVHALISEVLMNLSHSQSLLTAAFGLLEAVLAEASELGEDTWIALVQIYEANAPLAECLFGWITASKALSQAAVQTVYGVLLSHCAKNPVETVSYPLFACFISLLLRTNQLVELSNTGQIQRTKLSAVTDLEVIYRFIQFSQDPQIRLKACNTLTDLLLSAVSTEGKTSIRRVFARLTALLAEDSPSRYNALPVLQKYSARVDDIVSPCAHEQGDCTVFFICPSDAEWTELKVYNTATVKTVRRAVALLRHFPAQSVILTYNRFRYTFMQDECLLTSLPHNKHFTVELYSTRFALTPLENALNCNTDTLKLLASLLTSASERPVIEEVWGLAQRVVGTPRVKAVLREAGESFFTLLEGSLGEVLVGLMAVEKVKSDPLFIAGVNKRGKDCFLRVLERTIEGGCSAVSSILVGKVVELLLKSLSIPQSPCSPEAAPAFLQSLFKLLLLRLSTGQKLYQRVAKDVTKLVTGSFEGRTELMTEVVTSSPEFLQLLASLTSEKNGDIAANDMCDLVRFFANSHYGLVAHIIDNAHKELGSALQSQHCPLSFFRLTTDLILSDTRNYSDFGFDLFFGHIVDCCWEPAFNIQHNGLVGCLQYFAVLVHKDAITLDNLMLLTETLLRSLFTRSECLAEHHNRPPFKSHESRKAALRTLAEAVKSEECRRDILAYLEPLLDAVAWRTAKFSAWNRPEQQIAPRNGDYAGLKNLGATCYFNSVVQQLYGLSAFHTALFHCPVPTPAPSDLQTLSELQRVFIALQCSEKSRISPRRLCASYCQAANQQVDFFTQADASECLLSLLNHLSETIGQHYSVRLIDLFTFMIDRKTEPECGHVSQMSEHNVNLSLNIEGFGSILEALQTCFEVETLAEGNAYECAQCRKKLSAQRRQVIRSPPLYLILALNRFAYDASAQERRKISSHCSVPLTLDIAAYLGEGAADYRLQGVVLHTGTPEAGHYTSLRRAGERWLLLDDASVQEVQESTVLSHAAGPLEAASNHSAPTAYLLIYQDAQRGEEGRDQDSDVEKTLVADQQERNHQYWAKVRLFSPEMSEFQTLLAGKVPGSFSLRYFYTVGIRLDSPSIPLLKTLFQQLEREPEMADWSLSVFSQPQMLNELILQCPLPLKRKTLISFATQSYIHANSPAKESLALCLTATRARLPAIPTSDQEGFYELIYRLAVSETNPASAKRLVSMALSPLFGQEVDKYDYVVGDLQACLGRQMEAIPVFSPISSLPALSYISALCRLAVSFDLEDVTSAVQKEDLLRRLVRGSNTRFGANNIAQTLISLVQTGVVTEDVLRAYFGILQEQVQDCRIETFPYALMQIKRLIAYYNDRRVTDDILSALEHHFSRFFTEYIHSSECLVRFFYRLGTHFPSVNAWLLDHTDFLGLISSWQAKYSQCSADNMQGLSFAPDHRPLSRPFAPNPAVLAAASALLEQNFPANSVDSDDEADTENAEVGTWLSSRYSDEKYYPVEVKLGLGAVLVLQFPDYIEFLKEADSEDLKPGQDIPMVSS